MALELNERVLWVMYHHWFHTLRLVFALLQIFISLVRQEYSILLSCPSHPVLRHLVRNVVMVYRSTVIIVILFGDGVFLFIAMCLTSLFTRETKGDLVWRI